MLPPRLPQPRGPISAHALRLLHHGSAPAPTAFAAAIGRADLGDDDLQLALYALYELHYRGFEGVDPAMEWAAEPLELRARLEARFEELVRAAVHESDTNDPPADPPADPPVDIHRAIAAAAGPSLSQWVERHATAEHLRELAIHRSPYQLKEADPHTWAIPRLPAGPAKSALLALQFDEYGNGRPGHTHAELFADTMRSLDLDARYGHHLDAIPGITLATVNLLSMFGLHRRWLGACVGHLAVFEMTSVSPMARYAATHRRVTGVEWGCEFYDTHVAADALHGVIAAEQLVPAFIEQLPQQADDVLFGARALLAVEERFATHVLDRWARGRTSLLEPRRQGAVASAA